MSEFASPELLKQFVTLAKMNRRQSRSVLDPMRGRRPGRPKKPTQARTLNDQMNYLARLRSVNDQSLRRLGIRT